jgi:hypothetical protein
LRSQIVGAIAVEAKTKPPPLWTYLLLRVTKDPPAPRANASSMLFINVERSDSPIYSNREAKLRKKLPSMQNQADRTTDLPSLASPSNRFQRAVY